MIRRSLITVLAVAIIGVVLAGVTPRVTAQPAARRLAFVDVAIAVVQNNLELRAAAFEVAVAGAQLAQARGGRLPQVHLSASYARTQEGPGQTLSFPNPFGPTPPVITITLPPPDPNISAARLAVQYPLYTGGRLEAQIALAEANVRGAQAVFERTKQQVASSAEQIYLQALLGQNSAAAAQRALDQARESLRMAQARVRAGAAAQFDVLQAEVAVANAEQALVRAQTSVGSAAADLSAALNLPLDTAFAFTDTLTPRPVDGTLVAAIAQALRVRPDLQAVRSRIEAAQASIDLAASGGRPTVSLGAGYDLGNSNGMATGISGSWSVTLGVILSVFDGAVTRERIREAQLRLEQLKAQEAQLTQQVELEVRQAWLALASARFSQNATRIRLILALGAQ
jgi:outer membrane protein TolC